MEYAGTAPPGTTLVTVENSRKRRHHRQKIRSLAYVHLDQGNGGILRDVSEGGAAVQAVAALRAGQLVQVRFELLGPRTRIETSGRVAWANASGQAGVEFLDLAGRSLRMLKEWLFTQLLISAGLASGTDSIFIHGKAAERATELQFSGAPVAAAPAAASTVAASSAWRSESVWQPLSGRGLARLLDGLILAAAVLLFAVVALALTHVFPSWPVGLSLGIAVAVIFLSVYWFLSVGWMGATPGTFLAQLAFRDPQGGVEEEERARFR